MNFCFWQFAGSLRNSCTSVGSRSTRVHFSNFACSVVESFPILRAIFLAFKTWARLLVIFLVGPLWCPSTAFCFWCRDKLGLDNFWFYSTICLAIKFSTRSGAIWILYKFFCIQGNKVSWWVAATSKRSLTHQWLWEVCQSLSEIRRLSKRRNYFAMLSKRIWCFQFDEGWAWWLSEVPFSGCLPGFLRIYSLQTMFPSRASFFTGTRCYNVSCWHLAVTVGSSKISEAFGGFLMYFSSGIAVISVINSKCQEDQLNSL